MRDINALHPRMIEKVYQLIDLCAQNGITIGISECLRTVTEQDALYAKGRTAPGSIVTNAKGSSYSSMHQWGVAADFFLKMDIDGDGQISDDSYNNATKMFNKVGALAQSIGLEWGGSWKSIVDLPHVQLPDWGSTASKLRSTYGTPEAFMKTWEKSGNTQQTTQGASTAASSTTSTSTTGKAVCIAPSGLKVRAGIGQNADKLTAIPYKKECTVLALDAGTADGLTWAKVSYDGKTGYAAQKWLNVTKYPTTSTTTSSASTNAAGSEYSKSTVESAASKNSAFAGKYKTTANLILRTGAGKTKNAITTIPKGKTVQCYGYYTTVNGTNWYLVAYEKYTGFCSSDYLQRA